MTEEVAISVKNVGKAYRMWGSPAQRLVSPLTEALAGMLPRSVGDKLRRRQVGGRDFHALRNISMEVRRGEAVAIIGRNGSGKSTLLQIVAGTLQPTEGSVKVNGRVAALLELGSGFNPEFTGRENVLLNGAVLGLSRAEIDRRFDRIAAFADIGEFIEQPVKTYSSGMALRLAFAVMAHIDAAALIIDEALAVGDVYFMQKCLRFLREFREHGTLLFVSHDMGAVRSLCDSALWLEKGELRMSGSAQDVAAAYLAEANLSQKNTDVAHIKVAPSPTPARRETANVPIVPSGALPVAVVSNPLSVSAFNEKSAGFGDGRIKVVEAAFVDPQGVRLDSIHGGEVVCLAITGRGIESAGNVIFGFNIKDRLGQHLFGENTFRGADIRDIAIHAGESYQAKFTFQMPVLHRGEYVVTAAIASGTPGNHRQQHWLHEALVVTSATDWAHAGLVGLPMLDVTVNRMKVPAPV